MVLLNRVRHWCRLAPKARNTNPPVGARFFRAAVAFFTLSGALVLVPLALRALQNPAGSPGSAAASAQTAPATDPASAQPKSSTDTTGNNKIKVNVQVVNVPVTVLDKQGLPVVDLTQDDFKIYEDGKPQKITYFSGEAAPPLRIGLLMDTSNSARLQLKFEKDAANGFTYNMLRGLHSQNEIFLETFDATSSIIQDFTNNADTLSQKIDNLKAGGGKAVYDAIYFACKEKMMTAGPREQTRRVLVLISDGLDAQSQHSLDEAMSMAHRAETAIYTVGNAAYGFTNPGDKYLSKIAEDTGGAAFFPLRASPGTDLLTGYLAHGQFDDMEQNK